MKITKITKCTWVPVDYLATFAVSKMASSVFIWSKNRADIRDGNEYKIRKWLVLKFHGSGHLPNHTTSKYNNRMFENDHFQNCVYFRCFFSVLKPQCTAKWHAFYIRNRHISVSLLFTNTISDPMIVTWQEEQVSERQTT